MKLRGPFFTVRTIHYLLDSGFFEKAMVDWTDVYDDPKYAHCSKPIPCIYFRVGKDKELNEFQKKFFDYFVSNAAKIEHEVRLWLMNRGLPWLTLPITIDDLDTRIYSVQIHCKGIAEDGACLFFHYPMKEEDTNRCGTIYLILHEDGRIEEMPPDTPEDKYFWD